MNEHGAVKGRISMSDDDLPDLVKRNLDDFCAKPFDCFQLRLWSVVGNDYCAGNLVLTRLPSESLGHVPRATSVHSTFSCVCTREGDRVADASDFEGASRL